MHSAYLEHTRLLSPRHSDHLEFSFKALRSLEILFQGTQIIWNSLPRHLDLFPKALISFEFSRCTRLYSNALELSHKSPRMANCHVGYKSPRKINRHVGHKWPHRTNRPIGHKSPCRANPPIGHKSPSRANCPVRHKSPRRANRFIGHS